MLVSPDFFYLDLGITAFVLVVAVRLSFIRIDWLPLLSIVALSSFVSLMPVIGVVIGAAVYCFLLVFRSNAEWIDGIWFWLFAKLVSVGFGFITGDISVG
ncbi:hypothetical protein [Alteromonas flava]|uniref:hypothetical protein n=1 Tax=Alteromonas flava TaxID=2048003 RepID=UPI000C28FED6|nr:hypothetical protein [Alteromonas flava]